MIILYNWLKEFVPLDISASKAAETLERLGFEVARIQDLGASIVNVVTAEVREAKKHPNADRLSVCRVWDGTQEHTVVCGAPNVREGQKVALAKVGAILPNDFRIKAAKIRGVDSQGMLCSSTELGLEEKSDGIRVLSTETPLGLDIRSLLGLDDTIIEIEVTPNRRDALSVLGIARELAAGLGLSLKNPEPRVREAETPSPLSVLNEAQDLCPRYIARLLREVRVGPSPEWMVQRLSRCGIRSINNIVDITNYVLLELGQPMHAFDAMKMKGKHVRIRRSRAGEDLTLLDGRHLTLSEGTLVIADEERPAALAGIMGGAESSITADTQEIILESAAFLSTHIRLNSKFYGVSSESSYRFERGSDWGMVALASKRAAQLIQELSGGTSFKPLEASSIPPAGTPIKLSTEKISQFLGIELKDSVAAEYLRRLGCEISMGTTQLAATIPSWRLDLVQEADLLEEIARLHGYDQIPEHAPTVKISPLPESTSWLFERKFAGKLAGLGMREAINSSFLSVLEAQAFIPGFGQPANAKPVEIANPLSQDQALLRTSIIPGLLKNAIVNFTRQISGVTLFELGRVFHDDGSIHIEQRRAGLILGGDPIAAHWRQKSRPVDFYDMSGLLEALAHAYHLPNLQITPANHAVFHPNRSAVLWSATVPLAWFGEIHPDLLTRLDTTRSLVAAELDLDNWRMLSPSQFNYSAKSIFPPVCRDISLIAEDSVPYDQILRTLRASSSGLLETFNLIDLYHGDKIGAGKKSMTLSLVFRHPDKTLNDSDVEKMMTKIVGDLQIKCGATLRK